MASPDCCSNPPTMNPTAGGGRVVDDFGDLRTYIAGGSPADAKHAVLLISDVFGFEAPNLRKIADKIAASGFFVVVPDLLYGDPFSIDNKEKPFPLWIQSHFPEKACQDTRPVISALKSQGISAIGAAGFCWGGKVVVELAKSSDIDAAVILHPSFVTVDDIKEVKCPIAVLGAENDHSSPPEVVRQFEDALSNKPGAIFFKKIFPGVVHGWSVRYNVDDASAVKSAEEAHEDMLSWFVKHLKSPVLG